MGLFSTHHSFIKSTPFFKVPLLKVKIRLFAQFFYWATSAHT
jgi:hypothetical protein